MIHYGDIEKLSGYELPIVDCVAGGSPCQGLSVAGHRAGLQDERSALFSEQIRIVKEMREHDRINNGNGINIKPRYMVWENVTGALSSPGRGHPGEDFQAALTEIVKIVEPSAPDVPLPKKGKWSYAGCLYDEMGKWSIAWRVHNAESWGVPQRRRRVGLVADFGGLSAPEVLFERKGLLWDSGQSYEDGSYFADPIQEDTSGAISFQERAGKPGGGKGILIQSERVGTLSTQNNQSVFFPREGMPNVVRHLTPLEFERLQGYPDGWTDIGDYVDTEGNVCQTTDRDRYKALGNSIAIPFWFYLMRRLSAQYERPATLGSLFDGIGGFPLCWERCNGIGTAIWASEIEEFPIAVTKLRFPEN